MASSDRELWVIVPAAGIGARMGSEKPKQYLPLLGATVLDISLKKMLSIPGITGVVLALHPEDKYWPSSEFYGHPKIHQIDGGLDRKDSVYAGLCYLQEKENHAKDNQGKKRRVDEAPCEPAAAINYWALVHDAARPCVCLDKIKELINKTHGRMGGILAVPVSDTLKRSVTHFDHISTVYETPDRRHHWLAHTPQLFPVKRLRESYEFCFKRGLDVTDEASAYEFAGWTVDLIEDKKDNIKITVPEDLALAEFILKKQNG